MKIKWLQRIQKASRESVEKSFGDEEYDNKPSKKIGEEETPTTLSTWGNMGNETQDDRFSQSEVRHRMSNLLRMTIRTVLSVHSDDSRQWSVMVQSSKRMLMVDCVAIVHLYKVIDKKTSIELSPR